ncbi:MAG: class I SAM-dependent methyltransferase [Bacteroidales bacterium]
MERIATCPLCGSSDTMPFISCRDHLVSKKLFHVEQCRACQLAFTNPRPNKLKISAFYASADYVSHSDRPRSMREKIYHGVKRYMLGRKLRWVHQFLDKGSRIMDVGCGTGAFLEALVQKGFDARGFEPGLKARQTALAKGLDVSGDEKELEGLPEESLHGITLWHVLEHMHDVAGKLSLFHRLLVPGGKILIAVPLYQSLDAAFYKQHWAAYDLPRHLYHFNETSLTRALAQSGFSLVARKGLPFDAFYVSLLSEQQADKWPGFARVLRALAVGAASNLAGFGGRKSWSSEVFVFEKQA